VGDQLGDDQLESQWTIKDYSGLSELLLKARWPVVGISEVLHTEEVTPASRYSQLSPYGQSAATSAQKYENYQVSAPSERAFLNPVPVDRRCRQAARCRLPEPQPVPKRPGEEGRTVN
jgi:hypothetical protein